MGFDVNAFGRAEFTERIEEVEMPALAGFFNDGPPVWRVRGLTAAEVYRCNEAVQKRRSLDKVIRAISDNRAKVDEVRSALGLHDDVPGELAKRLEQLVAGSVDPVISLDVAVKLAEKFPIEFTQLTNVIIQLTGMGADLVKPKAALQVTQS